jgi:hypothetical protein
MDGFPKVFLFSISSFYSGIMATRNVTKKKMAAIAPTTYLAESIE